MKDHMPTFTSVLAAATMICIGTASVAYADSLPTRPLRSAITGHGVANAHLLIQSAKPVRIPGRSCRRRVCAGAAIGAGFGALFGALVTNGDRGGAAVGGAIIFSILGAGFGYKACGP